MQPGRKEERVRGRASVGRHCAMTHQDPACKARILHRVPMSVLLMDLGRQWKIAQVFGPLSMNVEDPSEVWVSGFEQMLGPPGDWAPR